MSAPLGVRLGELERIGKLYWHNEISEKEFMERCAAIGFHGKEETHG